MRIHTVKFVVFLIPLLWFSPSASRLLTVGSKAAPMAAQKISGKLPVSFEFNQGQAHPEVKFLAHGVGYRLSLMPAEAVMELATGREDRTSATLRMQLIGANRNARVRGLEQLPGSVNYFLGNDSRQWRGGVPTYAKVEYQKIYPGIDLIYYRQSAAIGI